LQTKLFEAKSSYRTLVRSIDRRPRAQPNQTYSIGRGAELPDMTVIVTIRAEVDRGCAEAGGAAVGFSRTPAARGAKCETLKTQVMD
jgi:dTDP-glucose 4,6-dehydratase